MMIVLFIMLLIVLIGHCEILLTTGEVPQLILDGPVNGSKYSLGSNINESNLIIRYRLDEHTIYNINDIISYEICIVITRFSYNVINYCTNVFDSLVSNTLNITDLESGDYMITFELKSSDAYNEVTNSYYCDVPYLLVPKESSMLKETSVLVTIKKFIDELPTPYIINDNIYAADYSMTNDTDTSSDIRVTYYISNTSLDLTRLSICYYMIELSPVPATATASPSFKCSSLEKQRGTLYLTDGVGKYQLSVLIVENIDQDSQTYLSVRSNQITELLEVKNLADVMPIINLHDVYVDKNGENDIILHKVLQVSYSISGIPTAVRQVQLCVRSRHSKLTCDDRDAGIINVTVVPQYNGFNNNKTLVLEVFLKNIKTGFAFETFKKEYLVSIDRRNDVHYQSLSAFETSSPSSNAYLYQLSVYTIVDNDNLYLLVEFLHYYIEAGIDHFYIIADNVDDIILKDVKDLNKYVTIYSSNCFDDYGDNTDDSEDKRLLVMLQFSNALFHETEWVTVINLNEFIHPCYQLINGNDEHYDIKNILLQYGRSNSQIIIYKATSVSSDRKNFRSITKTADIIAIRHNIMITMKSEKYVHDWTIKYK